MTDKMTDRCHKCKKFSLLLTECKCKNNFCIKHTLPEKHSCENLYDFCKISYEKNMENLYKYSIKPTSNFVKLE